MTDEQLILVDESNRATGSGGKTAVHRAGLLHRAFSIFVVDDRGRILLQRRNPKKYHSGGLWANSCCGHPRPGERTVTAARRRLNEELGVSSDLMFGFFSRYRTELDNGMHENEFVYVYFGPLRLLAAARPGRGFGRRAALGRGDQPPARAAAGLVHSLVQALFQESSRRHRAACEDHHPQCRETFGCEPHAHAIGLVDRFRRGVAQLSCGYRGAVARSWPGDTAVLAGPPEA